MLFKSGCINWRNRNRGGKEMKTIDPLEFNLWLQGLEHNKEIIDEAVKISRDYPHLTMREVIEIAKRVVK